MDVHQPQMLNAFSSHWNTNIVREQRLLILYLFRKEIQ